MRHWRRMTTPTIMTDPTIITVDDIITAATIITGTIIIMDTAIMVGITTTTDTATTTVDAIVHSRGTTAITAMHLSINVTIAVRRPQDAITAAEVPVHMVHPAQRIVHIAVQGTEGQAIIMAAKRERQHEPPTEARQYVTKPLRVATV